MSRSDSSSAWPTVAGVIGIALYALVGYLYLVSGLVVPLPWLLILWLAWFAGWYLVIRTYRSRRVWVALVAVGAGVLWWVFVTVGGALFGWTA